MGEIIGCRALWLRFWSDESCAETCETGEASMTAKTGLYPLAALVLATLTFLARMRFQSYPFKCPALLNTREDTMAIELVVDDTDIDELVIILASNFDPSNERAVINHLRHNTTNYDTEIRRSIYMTPSGHIAHDVKRCMQEEAATATRHILAKVRLLWKLQSWD